ncbi:IS110 family transposase [Pseudomonas abietaniphila]|uniref:IS110 family transposase n=1 Tax=Pseudomonas abietaniphila TaxID=89065 RepID=UPI000784C039|nr:IS110 family transposase [Pseudomonas abietaniphila]
MAILDAAAIVGVDVAMAELVTAQRGVDKTHCLVNARTSIHHWLKTLPQGSAIALEATNTYHLDLVEMAHDMGHLVFVVDAARVSKYRESLGKRAKTDACDAHLLARYLEKEGDELRQWSPPPELHTQLKHLLHRRASLVNSQTALRQGWKDEKDLRMGFEKLMRRFSHLIKDIEKQLKDVLIKSGEIDQVKRCQGIEGVGFLTATALFAAFLRGEFKNVDSYIAYLGLDLRVSDSGNKSGRRRLSKKGDPEVRRLGFNASMAACRSATWKPYYEKKIGEGKARTEALTILSRKLAGVAFSLMKKREEYDPTKRLGVAPQT